MLIVDRPRSNLCCTSILRAQCELDATKLRIPMMANSRSEATLVRLGSHFGSASVEWFAEVQGEGVSIITSLCIATEGPGCFH